MAKAALREQSKKGLLFLSLSLVLYPFTHIEPCLEAESSVWPESRGLVLESLLYDASARKREKMKRKSRACCRGRPVFYTLSYFSNLRATTLEFLFLILQALSPGFLGDDPIVDE